MFDLHTPGKNMRMINSLRCSEGTGNVMNLILQS